MARVKLSEYRAKNILANVFGYEYTGIEVFLNNKLNPLGQGSYAVKVDQAIKKRNTLGLVRLDQTNQEALESLEDYKQQGYSFALLEPMYKHASEDERFIAMERTEEGVRVSYSPFGGVDIESQGETVQSFLVGDDNSWKRHIKEVDPDVLDKLFDCFETNSISYLELNPLISNENVCIPLDAAIEVDSAAEFSVKGAWKLSDIRNPKMVKTESEKEVEDIQSTSPASFSLRVLNADGGIFLLLSGGGASVVLADELSQRGLTNDIANYGEYSGNPNDEETYRYTKAVIDLMKSSNAGHKILLIAGGVANFTDIAKTFNGVIRALEEEADFLKQEGVGVYVRRGGPNQEKGLAKMQTFLDLVGLPHFVQGPDVTLAGFIDNVIPELKK